jgi:hypothetical protein
MKKLVSSALIQELVFPSLSATTSVYFTNGFIMQC